METGRMVVLLNLQSLYESLYDALNQYYVRLGGHKYVDLGLGTHRVKCRVHPGFRLIVIEEKDVVYRQFPVPLVNRLEKHYLDIHTVLPPWQRGVAEELQAWVAKFVDLRPDQLLARHKYSPADVFIGFHSDTCASVVLQVAERLGARDLTGEHYQQVLEEAKLALLGCATPDAVVRLSASLLGGFTAQGLSREYYSCQRHDSFADFLQAQLRTVDPECRAVFTEVTTFSRLLTSQDCECLGAELAGRAPRPTVLSLQQFDTEYSFLKDVRNCLMKTARYKILIIQTDFEDGGHSAQLIASAKYSATNEINKLQGQEDCVLVYFITKLSRMGSDAAYVGFHGGLWHSVHIDDLHRSTAMASDVTRLQNVPISQLFQQGDGPERESRRQGRGKAAWRAADSAVPSPPLSTAPVPLLDSTQLLQSCVQSAVGMLRDPAESGQRNMRRVELLLGLLTSRPFAAAFLQVLKVRLHGLLRRQEENQLRSQDWVLRAASNQDALQEAGTFRNSLWKRVQGVVTPLLASVVSFIDRDGNLELLARPRPPAWTRALWMFIFTDTKLLDIPLVTSDTRSKGEVTSILVQNHMSLPEGADTPFSWRIKDYLEELWVQAQYITNAEGLPGKLVEIFRQTPLGSFVARLPAEQQRELLQCFLRDFVLLSMSVSTGEEFKVELLQMALWACMRELSAAAGQPEDGLSLPWVLLAQQHFASRLQNLSRILTLKPQVLPSLAQKHDLAGSEMTLDVFAAMACAEMLTRDTLQPSARDWLQQVKSLSTPLELVCSEGHLQGSGHEARAVSREVRAQWRRISSVALFVEHVLLGAESQIPELCPQVTSYVFSLDKCLQENSDLKEHRPFLAVLATLCECQAVPCPICLGDAQDPVCLPCDHVFCLHCLRTWLAPGQMLCPFCLTDLPDGFQLTVSQEHSMAIAKHAQFRQLCNSFFVDLVSSMCFRDDSPPHRDVVQGLLSLLFVQKELLRREPQGPREHTKSLSPFNDVVDKTPVIRSVVLKLLLKYSFREVQDYLQDYLTLLEKKSFLVEDKTELYLLFLNCLEVGERPGAVPPGGGRGRAASGHARPRHGRGAAELPVGGGALLCPSPERLVPRVRGAQARQPARHGVCAAPVRAGPPVPVGVPQGSRHAAGEMRGPRVPGPPPRHPGRWHVRVAWSCAPQHVLSLASETSVCTCVCTCVHMCLPVCACARVYAHVRTYVHCVPVCVHVSAHMCVCMCVCARACTCACLCVHVHMCMPMCAHMCVCSRVCACVCPCVHVYVCVPTCAHVCACPCVHARARVPACVCMCTCVCSRVHICACVFPRVCTCLPICACVCACVPTCAHVCARVSASASSGKAYVGVTFKKTWRRDGSGMSLRPLLPADGQ
uniref:RING-type domain-containing protein n=1 Tax=Oryctolagus cuniculus TaxID=9986 RepID=G1U8H8_RABIT